MWQPERYFWKTPGRLPTVWQVEKTRRANRENVGPSVPRGRRDSHPQCQIAGHETCKSRQLTKERLKLWQPAFQSTMVQLAVDITLRSAVTSVGAPRTTAATVNGAALTQARRDKEAKYAELVRNERCRLVVVALKTGGRWGTEALEFVADMASSRARDAPPVVRRSAFLARAFAASLVVGQRDAWAGVDGSAPDLADLYREG